MYVNNYHAPPPPPPQASSQPRPFELDDLFGPPQQYGASYLAPPPLPAGDGFPSPPPSYPPPPMEVDSPPPSSVPPAGLPQGYPYSTAPYTNPITAPANVLTPTAVPRLQPPPEHLQVAYPSAAATHPYYGPPAHLPTSSQAPHMPFPIPSAMESPAAHLLADEADRAQLEKIVRLRRELELEQERERQKREELQTWPCVQCTFRNQLSVNKCTMCDTARPGYTATVTPAAPAPTLPPAVSSSAEAKKAHPETAWLCSMCSAPNGSTDERCKMCFSYRANGTPIPSCVSKKQGKETPRRSTSVQFMTDWECSVCGTVNSPDLLNCKQCNGYQRNGKPVERDEPPAVPEVLPPTWMCSVCTLENSANNAVCCACHSGQRPRHLAPASGKEGESHEPRRPERRWPCATCTYINSVKRSKCDMCGTARPAKYAPAPSDKMKEEKKREDDSDDDEIRWQDDNVAKQCNQCNQSFGITRRRHHCRACGYVFCASCSSTYLTLKKGSEPQRVCSRCCEARKKPSKK